MDRLRASFGNDVDVSKLPVYEASILNTQPLRKSGGMFKGAVNTPRTLTDLASLVNTESRPIQIQHDTDTQPFGRVFYCEVLGGTEARALFTVTDPVVQAKIDNGTIDQVSVGMMPSTINCSSCGFDFLGPDASIDNLFSLTCSNGHTLGENGVHAVLDGAQTLFELSLVGQGAAQGARIVGPSESRLQGNQTFKLAASSRSDGFAGVFLTSTAKDNTPVDLSQVLGQLTAATTEKAELTVKLTAAEANVTTLQASVTALEATKVDLEAKLAAAPKAEDLTAAQADAKAATDALREEAKTILTACNKEGEIAALEAKSATDLLAVIAEHRAQFAAAIPIGGRSKPADHKNTDPATATNTAAAFSTRR